MTIAAIVAAVAATALADLRWLRVAQREHYLPGEVTRFALRWWLGFPPSLILLVAAIAGAVASTITPVAAIGAAAAIALGPFRYSLRGHAPGPVVFTKRLRSVAAVTAVAQAVVIAGVAILSVRAAVPVAALIAVVAPLAIDAALAVLQPIENHNAERFVADAKAKLGQIHPTVVAITGSYGKTTTKVYAAHLIAGAHSVVPTPASFNNRAGLSRAINENLAPGTEVFIAEMGTYGPGEIAELCAWCPPRIAAITAIGPVHLERFGSEDAIVRAKSEIFEHAEVAVLNIDDPRLAALAETLTQTVVRCSTSDPAADVAAVLDGDRIRVTRAGQPIVDLDPTDASLGNIAVATALSFAVGTSDAQVAAALRTLPAVANRRSLTTLSTGATAIDDTFNSNPAGARAALAALGHHAVDGHHRVVVTPGMVELGPRQAEENTAFARDAAALATHLVIVGHTNRKALLAGAQGGDAAVLAVDDHAAAVAWVKANTSAGDVVLYENQLPDHYP